VALGRAETLRDSLRWVLTATHVVERELEELEREFGDLSSKSPDGSLG